eukprot:GHRR01037283.1.p1 GENE.GHRR01037283.1~~GHRR01037283.1.p1  ORF type:complete len:119 (+),score=9.38 GHRR01037283.1:19-375(+)
MLRNAQHSRYPTPATAPNEVGQGPLNEASCPDWSCCAVVMLTCMKVTNFSILPSARKRRVSSILTRTKPKKRRSLLNLYVSKLLSSRLYQPFPTSLNDDLCRYQQLSYQCLTSSGRVF